MKNILVFDMDGVLLESRGYHMALQETVRLSGEQLSLQKIHISQEQIHSFESLGISSEWHSSALCMAFLKTQLSSGIRPKSLGLEELFRVLEQQPFNLPGKKKSITAINHICEDRNLDPAEYSSIVSNSEDINLSKTFQWFQELVIGTEAYENRYKKPGKLNTESFLALYDIPKISQTNSKLIARWIIKGFGYVVIMTNRPSAGPAGFSGSPEAELGLDLVKMPFAPLIGYGDISWLSSHSKTDPETLIKPNPVHALASILHSVGVDKEQALKNALIDPALWPVDNRQLLMDASITIFEDTPAGLASGRAADDLLSNAGINVDMKYVGIARDSIKIKSLEAQGAQVYPDINSALCQIDNFGSFS